MLLKTAFNLISLNFNKKISLKKNIKKLMQSYNVIFFNKMHMYFKNFDILKNMKQCDKIIILKIIMKDGNDKHLDMDQKYSLTDNNKNIHGHDWTHTQVFPWNEKQNKYIHAY